MQGKATIAGHPVHPMLVGFPIGLFGGVLVSDVISIWGSPFWHTMSMWLIAFGVVSALLAAVFGFVDYLTAPMSRDVKATATKHLVLKLIVVALYVVAFFVRKADPVSTMGYILTYVALATLTVSAWYGGHLVYAGSVGVQTAADSASPEERIAQSARIPTRVP